MAQSSTLAERLRQRVDGIGSSAALNYGDENLAEEVFGEPVDDIVSPEGTDPTEEGAIEDRDGAGSDEDYLFDGSEIHRSNVSEDEVEEPEATVIPYADDYEPARESLPSVSLPNILRPKKWFLINLAASTAITVVALMGVNKFFGPQEGGSFVKGAVPIEDVVEEAGVQSPEEAVDANERAQEEDSLERLFAALKGGDETGGDVTEDVTGAEIDFASGRDFGDGSEGFVAENAGLSAVNDFSSSYVPSEDVVLTYADFSADNPLAQVEEIIASMGSDADPVLLETLYFAQKGQGWALNNLAHYMAHEQHGMLDANEALQLALFEQALAAGYDGAAEPVAYLQDKLGYDGAIELSPETFAEQGVEEISAVPDEAVAVQTLSETDAVSDFIEASSLPPVIADSAPSTSVKLGSIDVVGTMFIPKADGTYALDAYFKYDSEVARSGDDNYIIVNDMRDPRNPTVVPVFIPAFDGDNIQTESLFMLVTTCNNPTGVAIPIDSVTCGLTTILSPEGDRYHEANLKDHPMDGYYLAHQRGDEEAKQRWLALAEKQDAETEAIKTSMAAYAESERVYADAGVFDRNTRTAFADAVTVSGDSYNVADVSYSANAMIKSPEEMDAPQITVSGNDYKVASASYSARKLDL